MYKNNTFLAIIPARGGSKGLHNKNIKELCGKPLIVWSIEAGLQSEYIDEVIVSTDYRSIADIAKKHGAYVPFLRPDHLASDTTTTFDTVKHVIDFYNNELKKKFDYTCQACNLKFEKIKNINVIGLNNEDNIVLLQNIKKLNLKNIFSINKSEISNQIDSDTLVENYEVFKKYPSSLIVNVKKTKFLARVNNNGKIFLVGSNGKLSKNNLLISQLPFIFGSLDIEEFLTFKKIVEDSKISYDMIENFYFFSSKRWDLELKNNILIKLSGNYPEESLQLALEFLYNDEFRDIKTIDARIKNQIILYD